MAHSGGGSKSMPSVSDGDKKKDAAKAAAIGAAAGVVAGLAGLGLYMGGKKLLNSRQKQQQQRQKSAEKASDDRFELVFRTDSGVESLSLLEDRPPGAPSPTVNDILERYHIHKAYVPKQEVQASLECTDGVIDVVLKHLKAHSSELKISLTREPTLIGSTAEDLCVVKADQFNYMLYLDLDPRCWQLESMESHFNIPPDVQGLPSKMQCDSVSPSGGWLMNMHQTYFGSGFWKLHRINSGSIRYDPYDKHQTDGCLDLIKMQQTLQHILHQLRPHGLPGIILKPITSGAQTGLVVHKDKQDIYIDFVLAACLPHPDHDAPIEVATSPHPLALRGRVEDSQVYWSQYHPREEYIILNSAPVPALKCLRILKAGRLGNPILNVLNPYLLKTLMLHCLSTDHNWHGDRLVDNTMYMLETLENFLIAGFLPHFFHPEVNLLNGYNEETLNKVMKHLSYTIQNGDILNLLSIT